MEALKRPPTQIIKNLWIGTEWNSCSRDLLVELNIRYILNAGYPQCKNHFQEEHENYKYLTAELYDGNLEQDLLQHLEPSFMFIEFFFFQRVRSTSCLIPSVDLLLIIDEALNRNQGVLVHDKSGNSRAAAIIIAYVMFCSGCTLKEAYQHVKSMRKSIDPSMDFMVQLNSFEMDAIGFSSMIPSEDLTPAQKHLLRTRVLTSEIVGLKYGALVPSLVDLTVDDFEDEIVDHIAQQMLQEKWNELGVFYSALKHHPRVLKLFRSTFYAYVKSKLEKIVAPLENVTGKDLDKIGADVLQALFDFLSHMQRLTVTIFGTKEGLDNALNQGQIYLSRVQGAKLFTMYLTRHVHKIMTQSQTFKNTEVEQEANEKLDKLVRVLKSLCATSQENDQTFVKYMTQLLANRLLSTTINLDFEMNLIFKLRVARFTALAKQMEEMIKDLNIVKDIKKDEDSKTTLSLKIASSNKLPAEYLMSSLMAMQGHSHSQDQTQQEHSHGHSHEHQSGHEHSHKHEHGDKMDVDGAVSSMLPEFVLPPEVASTLNQFKEQFQGDESANKKLMVLPHLGECEMTYESKNKKYNLIVPTSVMIVLCCFEEKDQLTGQELQLQTNLPGRLLMQTLYTLTDGPVKLLLREPSTSPIAPTNVFKLNEEFSSKTKRVKIQLIQVPK